MLDKGGKKRTVLIAEDEDGVRLYLKVILERFGYDVAAVGDGREALSFIREAIHSSCRVPALIITDIAMPQMGGFELLDFLDSNGIRIPSAIVSSSQEKSHILEALRRGCHDFIEKPLSEKQVHEVISRIFDKLEKGRPHFVQNYEDEDNAEPTIQVERETSIGDYIIEYPLGTGGGGTVYLCHKDGCPFKFAVKTLSIPHGEGINTCETAIRRFMNESRAISLIKHQGIVRLLDSGIYKRKGQEVPFIAMEYIDGKPLSYYIKRPDALSFSQKLAVISMTARALDAVHSQSIFHRDIKPDNIIIDSHMHPRITDFGICHVPSSDLTKTSVIIGTPAYLAPEYLSSWKGDRLVDIYSLGVVAYELFTGRKPFESDNLDELICKILNEAPPEPRKLIPGFDLFLQEILAKMMKKNPRKRYQTALEAAEDLEKVEGRKHSFSITDSKILRRIKEGLFVPDWS